MTFPTKTLMVTRATDADGDFSVINASDFDAETMTVADPAPPAATAKPKSKAVAAKRGRPPGKANKPKE
tara:strand:+ start:21462 stop:21668 length:207 start_codon:yes stop_codon:yes gene_type:complete